MSCSPRFRPSALIVAMALALGAATLAAANESGAADSAAAEAAFLVENDAAMTKMMNDMAAKPTGDIDRDFALMMIPHHQGAVEMALAQLRYGKNEQLRRLAQEIIVEQLQEIAAMQLAIGEPLPPSVPAPTQQLQPAPPQAAAPAQPMSSHHHHASPAP